MINDIICHCFESINIREELLRYLKKKYDTNPNYPWKRDPTSITLKTNVTNKWYGLKSNSLLYLQKIVSQINLFG